MPVGPAANILSLSEKSKKLIFPAQDNIRVKIPLWMKFYCYEYSSTAFGRVSAQNVAGGGGDLGIMGLRSVEKASIFLPAPVNFQTNTSHKYVPENTSAPNLFQNYLGGIASAIFETLGIQGEKLKSGLEDLVTGFENIFGDASGFASELEDLDVKDAMFSTIGPSRSYEIRMNLPCLTEQDSKAASSIIRAFEALSLPTVRSTIGINYTKSFHPPLWVFGVGPIDQRKFDQDWSGHPQISVLRAVSHKKTAFETNALAALGHNTLLKPVAYTLSLSFLELEPAFRANNPFGEASTTIINRSTAMLTTGSSGVAKPGP